MMWVLLLYPSTLSPTFSPVIYYICSMIHRLNSDQVRVCSLWFRVCCYRWAGEQCKTHLCYLSCCEEDESPLVKNLSLQTEDGAGGTFRGTVVVYWVQTFIYTSGARSSHDRGPLQGDNVLLSAAQVYDVGRFHQTVGAQTLHSWKRSVILWVTTKLPVLHLHLFLTTFVKTVG